MCLQTCNIFEFCILLLIEDVRSYKLNSDNILAEYSHFWEFCLIFAGKNTT
jgi:hypothetical protein